LRANEKWIEEALLEKLPLILPEVALYLPPGNFSNAPFVQLAGWIENPKGGDTINSHTLKEVVVWQNPPSINIFNVVEHGRRFFRVLEYASNMSMCLHEVESEPYPDRVAGILAMSAGIPMSTGVPSDSLLISRALSKKIGTQVHIPKRFLAGIMPTAIIEKYSFWQSEDDNIVGYEEHPRSDDDDDEDEVDIESGGSSARLKITLLKGRDVDKTGFCNSNADALIQRVPVLDSNPEIDYPDPNQPILTLLNVRCAAPSSLLKRIGLLISRLDNLAHVLVWSNAQLNSPMDATSIDLIELPRVNLSFKGKKVENVYGKVEHRLYSNDHDGLYIASSTESREIVESLIGQIAHFIVLQNSDNDLFVLIPGCALPRRLNTDGTDLSVQVLLDRRNKEWIDNMGEVRCYLYPVHNSKGSSGQTFPLKSFFILYLTRPLLFCL
jgi:hypothetical protein